MYRAPPTRRWTGRPALVAWLTLAIYIGGAMAAPRPAAAQAAADIAQAKKWFAEAESAEKAGDCKAAIELFRKALGVKETPQLHLRIGRCQERLGQLTAALASYERALDRAREAGAAPIVP